MNEAVQIVEQPKPSSVLATSLNSAMVIQPKTMGELVEFAKMVAHSGMVPKDYVGNPGAVIVAMQMGAELGLSPMAALQNIAVINGRPSVWGDAGLAIVKMHRDFVKCEETRGPGWAKCKISRRDQPDVEHEYTAEDAKQAGLAGKSGPWSQHPKRMLQMRARWFAMRDQFPDALRGLSSAEESEDLPPRETSNWEVVTGGVEPKQIEARPIDPAVADAVRAFEAIGVSSSMMQKQFGALSEVPIERLRAVYGEVKQNPKRKAELFGQAPSAAADINQRFAAPAAVNQVQPEVDEKALADAARVAEQSAPKDPTEF